MQANEGRKLSFSPLFFCFALIGVKYSHHLTKFKEITQRP